MTLLESSVSESSAWPHDLVEIDVARAFQALFEERSGDLVSVFRPAALWVAESLATYPWVVVRRAPPRADMLAVGVRGGQRHMRHAAWIPVDAVLQTVAPHELVPRLVTLDLCIPIAACTAAVGSVLDAAGLVWGPGGSVGFHLATGAPCVHSASDLDVIVRAPNRVPDETLRRLHREIFEIGDRVDVRLETPAGGVHLDEIARVGPGGLVLAKTSVGPRLIDDPWAEDSGDRLLSPRHAGEPHRDAPR